MYTYSRQTSDIMLFEPVSSIQLFHKKRVRGLGKTVLPWQQNQNVFQCVLSCSMYMQNFIEFE